MKYTLIGLAIVFACVAGGGVVYRVARTRTDERGGFRDWVKDPEYKKAAAEYFAARESLEVPDDISDAEIQQMVDRLFVQKDEDFNFERLQLVGAKAVPFLIEGLEDPAKATRRFGKRGHVFDAQTPFERICDLLEPLAPPETVAALAGYLEHEDENVRKHAALVLGCIGNSQCIEPMDKAFADEDEYVRSYAAMGIQRSVHAGRCTQEFLDAMFPVLTKHLSDYQCSDTAARLLLEIDTDRALAVLLSPECFTIENRYLYRIIEALNKAGHRIPHDRLLPLLETVKPLADEYPHDYTYAAALKAYAYNPDASAEQTMRAELKSPNEETQKAAARGLAILSGIADAPAAVFDALEQHGFNALSQPQKHYYAVFIYDAEINNGGHSQYFVNSSGAHWKSALAGLKAIGAQARAQILHEATTLFGSDGPSEDDETRHHQLAGFSRRQDEALDDLDGRYYSSKENVRALLALYAVEHKQHFRAQD